MEPRKILMVDDEADILRIMDRRLSLEGFEVIATIDGSDTIALAKKYQPDIVLLDLNMPDIHGGEIACRLREDAMTEHIPVLFLSSLISDEESTHMKHNCGGNPIVSKSTRIPALIDVINGMIINDLVEAS